MLPCRWNINQRLARFVNDPKEFRSRLGEADALISGTFALLFFAQLYWLDSGLDVYVQQGPKANALLRYIGEDKSYKFDHSYGWSDNDQHRTLTKNDSSRIATNTIPSYSNIAITQYFN
ncbi:hypothetical protein KCU97_g17663, partial [Aureobasidium melanogenum]